MLPDIPYRKGTAKKIQNVFGGLDAQEASVNGAIRSMTNMSGDRYPMLATRQYRYNLPLWSVYTEQTHTQAEITDPHGMFWAGAMYVVDGTKLYKDGVQVTGVTLQDNEKVMCGLGERVIIWPDKVVYDPRTNPSTGQPVGLKSLEAETSVTGLKFEDGTFDGEEAEMNTITHPNSSFNWATIFSVGDAVTITGCSQTENNRTPIIREIDGRYLRFYENTFTGTSPVTENGSVTLKRGCPDLDFLCTNENRVWGCKDDTIWCSKMGDPTNWYVFDDISTSSWSVESGTPGKFTGCVSYMGYPCFFKENRVFKVYGSRPKNFEVLSSATLGVLPGAAKTMAVAAETLIYLSRAGFTAYTGGIPSPIGAPLGLTKFVGGVAGSDGIRYYVSAELLDGSRELYVYDAIKRMWFKEDLLNCQYMAWNGSALQLQALTSERVIHTNDGGIILMEEGGDDTAEPDDEEEEAELQELEIVHNLKVMKFYGKAPQVSATNGVEKEPDFLGQVLFGDFDMQTFDSKYPVRLWLRASANTGVKLKVQIKYDNGVYETAAEYEPGPKGQDYFPVPIRRCEHWSVAIGGRGPWKLWAMEQEYYAGTEARR